ncbi:hypothetical protein [Amycolatopsis magusensis]|uniref:hypothetical protein n=1 Tax=Amycolatopsis magusensis TaxID=882444 RepID=UPI003C300565
MSALTLILSGITLLVTGFSLGAAWQGWFDRRTTKARIRKLRDAATVVAEFPGALPDPDGAVREFRARAAELERPRRQTKADRERRARFERLYDQVQGEIAAGRDPGHLLDQPAEEDTDEDRAARCAGYWRTITEHPTGGLSRAERDAQAARFIVARPAGDDTAAAESVGLCTEPSMVVDAEEARRA